MCYNEEQFVSETIDNIIKQKTDDMTLVVSDNNSTDKTREILERKLANLPNTTLVNRNNNIGALESFNELCSQVDTEFLIFAGSHDLWGPNYLKTLLNYIYNNLYRRQY